MSAEPPPYLTPQVLCECGCGEPAPIATSSWARYGWVKGKPKRFVHGHRARLQSERVDDLYEIDPATDCWLWTGRVNPSGYGVFGDRLAHRLLWERDKRQRLAPTEFLDHLCHGRDCPGGATCPHRRCVNPGHLAVATNLENMRRGRKTKLTQEAVAEIRASAETPTDLSDRYGVAASTISNIRARRSWRDV